MIHEYIETALHHAHYEIIKDEQPYYGEVPELQGGLGYRKISGRMPSESDRSRGWWVLIRLARELPIPPMRSTYSVGQTQIRLPQEMAVVYKVPQK